MSKLIVGNWKMNKSSKEAQELLEELAKKSSFCCDIVVCVPYVHLGLASRLLHKSQIKLGAQNCCHETSHKFTGEISVRMLKDFGCEYVIVGHSERRKHFAEDDLIINKKVLLALKNDLKPILCVGEELHEPDGSYLKDVLETQLKIGLAKLEANQLKNCIIAYEPAWAINTKERAPLDHILNTISLIRGVVRELTAVRAAVIYGGSVDFTNSAELLKQPDIDGLLVGRASLDFSEFTKTIHSCPH
ncbi:MAG: triose-phosphate isomerase [Oscillospiraceae bacterium]|jgi:triosephosphate isomerase|nr:triose-phosphate isomerase [Oscillospiraceae bacterium]